MTLKPLFSNIWLSAVAAIVSIGCGGGVPAVKTEMVEGLVTLDGDPVSGATVTFVPVQDGVGATASGTTDSAGKYRLNAIGPGARGQAGAGTLPGEYYVGVVKVKLPEHPTSTEAAMPKEGQRPEASTMTYVVPQKYGEPPKSGIKKTVKQGMNDIPIELTSK